MDNIRNVLAGLPQAKKVAQSFQSMVEQLLKNEKIKGLMAEYPEITKEKIARSVSDVHQAIQEEENCNKCSGLHQCNNLMKGYKSNLKWTGSSLVISYQPCKLQVAMEEQKKREKLIQTHYIPREILGASFSDLERDEGRKEAIFGILQFCMKVEPGTPGTKGLYFWGPFGVGKSYLMAAAARKLSERGIASLMVYTPDFFREIKDSLQDNTTQQKIDAVKKVPVLIFDDIGAETLSPWARDEVLGAILQYRVSENLPVLYTSNFNYEDLMAHLAYSQKAGVEKLKAMRIMERIQHYTEAYELKGRNRRR